MVRPEFVKKALDEIRKRTANYEYFFNHLKSPDWIEPLFNEGLFQHPPEPHREGDYISFPLWPESRYLVRMASISPKLVLAIVLKIPTTANIRVHEDLADATSEACMKEPHLAAHWTDKEADWVASQQYLYLLLPEKLANLACNLAKVGGPSQALKLIKTLLAILPGTPIEDRDLKEESTQIPPEPRVRFDLHIYEQIIRKYIPQLIETIGKDVLLMLYDLLEAAASLSMHFPNKRFPEDYSYIWRPAVEDDKRNLGHNLKDILVSGARDGAEYLSMKSPEIIPELVQNLEGRRWKIFHRITLHLLRRFPEHTNDLLANRLTQKILFDDAEVSIRHEYSLLMGKCFASLTKDQQEIILKWIESGPDIAKFKASREEFWGRPVTDSDAIRYKKHWQLERLAWIKEDLPETWRQQYQLLIAELGEPEHPEFAIRTGATWVGPTSPKTADALRLLTTDQLVSFLETWHPSGEPENPSPEGLGRELTALVVSEPERFATEANRFKGLDPTYICALVYGFRDAVRQKLVLAWRPILELCLWVVNQPREIPERKGEYADLDPGWVWTRKAIANLLSSGFETNATEIPFDLRALVWQVLYPITTDPDPTPEHEAEYGGSNMDPATLSINTTRGEAMHAVIHYALWINRHVIANATGTKQSTGGFDDIPEVREVLEYHLNPNQDASLAIRSVYGRWFPSLVFLDETWAVKNKPVIFPSDERLRDMRNAAWESYIVFCPAYDNVFDILLEQYRHSVEKLGTSPKDKRYPADPEERLAEHLINILLARQIEFRRKFSVCAVLCRSTKCPAQPCNHVCRLHTSRRA